MSWVSLSVWRTRPSGATSPPIIFGPLVSMTCEGAAHRRGDVRRAARGRPARLGELQAFGERQAVEAEDEIDRELGAAAVADLADVKTLGEQRVEHRRG